MVEMAWPAIQQAAEDGAIIVLPVGVIEEHGPHLGLAPDVYLAHAWSQSTRRALETKGIRTLIAPPYYWGINVATTAFPGSFTVRPETFKAMLYDLHASLQQWGFSYVFSLNLHGDSTHNRVLQEGIKEAHDGLGIGAYSLYAAGDSVVDRNYVVFYDQPSVPPSWYGHFDIHAGASETGIVAALVPHTVNMELARTLPPSTGFEPNGYYGDPASFEIFDAEGVRAMFESYGTNTANAIEAFLNTQRS
jgi:creatinine amidohydrolase